MYSLHIYRSTEKKKKKKKERGDENGESGKKYYRPLTAGREKREGKTSEVFETVT